MVASDLKNSIVVLSFFLSGDLLGWQAMVVCCLLTAQILPAILRCLPYHRAKEQTVDTCALLRSQ